MVYLCNEWVQLRRYPTVLLESGAGSQTDAKGDGDTTTRMEQAEGGNTATTHQVPAHRCGRDVLESTEPLQPGERVIVSGMQSLSVRKRVRFSDRPNDVFELNDWTAQDYRNARKGPWLHYAADRHRFKRRIKQTELVLRDILTDSHRDRVRALQ